MGKPIWYWLASFGPRHEFRNKLTTSTEVPLYNLGLAIINPKPSSGKGTVLERLTCEILGNLSLLGFICLKRTMGIGLISTPETCECMASRAPPHWRCPSLRKRIFLGTDRIGSSLPTFPSERHDRSLTPKGWQGAEGLPLSKESLCNTPQGPVQRQPSMSRKPIFRVPIFCIHGPDFHFIIVLLLVTSRHQV